METCLAGKDKALKESQSELKTTQNDLDLAQQNLSRAGHEAEKARDEVAKMKLAANDVEQKVWWRLHKQHDTLSDILWD